MAESPCLRDTVSKEINGGSNGILVERCAATPVPMGLKGHQLVMRNGIGTFLADDGVANDMAAPVHGRSIDHDNGSRGEGLKQSVMASTPVGLGATLQQIEDLSMRRYGDSNLLYSLRHCSGGALMVFCTAGMYFLGLLCMLPGCLIICPSELELVFQGLHNIHGSYNLPNMPSSLASQSATMSGVLLNGVQQPGGVFLVGVLHRTIFPMRYLRDGNNAIGPQLSESTEKYWRKSYTLLIVVKGSMKGVP